MNILWVGFESSNWVINLCNEMCKKGNNITLICQGADEYDPKNTVKPHDNLEIIYQPYEIFEQPLKFRNVVLPQIINKKFDLLFGSHVNITPAMKLMSEILKKPWGIMILDIPTDLINKHNIRRKAWAFYFQKMRYADTIIFNTFVSRDEYYKFTHQYFPDENVITYGINMYDEFYQSGIDKKGDYALSICRLSPVKNCNLIPRALGFIDGIKKYKAVGWDRGDLEYIKRLCKVNDIEFEHLENITEKEKFELIRDCAMLIYPQNSKYIGGLSPWEGLFAGKPVLVPRVKILEDLYKDNVSYFINNDSVSLAREISFVNQLKPAVTKPIRERAARFAKKEASFEKMAERVLNILKNFGTGGI